MDIDSEILRKQEVIRRTLERRLDGMEIEDVAYGIAQNAQTMSDTVSQSGENYIQEAVTDACGHFYTRGIADGRDVRDSKAMEILREAAAEIEGRRESTTELLAALEALVSAVEKEFCSPRVTHHLPDYLTTYSLIVARAAIKKARGR